MQAATTVEGISPRVVGRVTPPSYLPVILLAIILLVVAAVRLRMLSIPLDRDEGECAYAGQLILDGHPPYLYAYNMKLPGAYYFFAAMMALFGESDVGIHFGLLLVNGISIALIFLLARALTGDFAAVMSAAVFALLTLDDKGVQGYHANMENFVLLFALLGGLCLLPGRRTLRKIALAGFLMGMAYIMKQHGLFFVLFGIALLVFEKQAHERREFRKISLQLLTFVGSAGVPFLCVCFEMLRRGVFKNFWFWTFSYARHYTSENNFADAWQSLRLAGPRIFIGTLSLWVLAVVSAIFLWRRSRPGSPRFWAFLFLLFSALAILPGLYLRSHYFILLFPALALLCGMGLQLMHEQLRRSRPHLSWIPAALCALAVASSIYAQRAPLFLFNPIAETRNVYLGTPFPEARQVGLYLRDHSRPGDRIAVLGSEPEIFFYAHRLSPSGFIYMYPFSEKQQYNEQMMQQFAQQTARAAPRFIVLVTFEGSWWTPRPRPGFMVQAQAMSTQLLQGYRMVGLFNIKSLQETDAYWGAQAAKVAPASDSVMIFERT